MIQTPIHPFTMDTSISLDKCAPTVPNRQLPLPDEVLSEIFLYCVPDEAPSATSPPLTLTWVCRHWREVAVSLPQLWTQITLGERGTDPGKDVRLLDLWVSRSGCSLPLDLKMYHEMKDNEKPVFFDPARGEKYIVGMKFLLNKLLSIAHRWRTLELHALDLYVLGPILRGLVNGAPRLEKLSVSTKYFDFFGSVFFLDMDGCPSLQNMRLLCPMLCPTASSQVANSMSSLEIRFCPLMKDCLTWLSICPNLERLSVRFFRAVPSSLPQNAMPLKLGRLKYLTVSCFSDDSDPNPLLELLELPSLSEFTLDMNGIIHSEQGESWSNRMSSILIRSSASLEQLTLLGTTITSDALLRLLRQTVQLRHLTISGASVDDSLIYALASTYQDEGAASFASGNRRVAHVQCPLLESLELREGKCSHNALVALITARAPRKSTEDDWQFRTLKKLALIWSPHRKIQDNPIVRECVDAGLHIESRLYNTGKLLYVH